MPKDVDDYMFKLITKLVKDRKENGTQYGTLMDVLLENNSANDDYNFEKILAHVFSLYTDSTETSAHTISYMLYEMALNLGVQNKLRNEIETVKAKYDGILTYEALQDLTYFDCVLNGTYDLTCLQIDNNWHSRNVKDAFTWFCYGQKMYA